MGARVTTVMQAVVGTLFVAGLFVSRPFAAQDAAALSGVVSDSTGAALPGVTVTATGPRHARRTVSNERGEFSLTGLDPGKYRVAFELQGFKKEERRVEVVSGRTTKLEVRLEVGSLTETVTVATESRRVHTRQAARISAATAPVAPPPAALSAVVANPAYHPPFNREAYAHVPESGFSLVSAQPRSTFSTDVDTASYTNVRRMLTEGRLPPAGAVRIEEFINYFRFEYAAPAGDAPIALSTEVAACPWNERHLIALVGVRAADGDPRDREEDEPRGRNLVFLVDVSGSMSTPDKLPLVQRSLHLLADRLTGRDRIAMVVYAGRSGTALPSTPGDDKRTIHDAIDRLAAGGSTNGAAGIQQAYRLARQQFVPGGVNRVMLATDGDFNVGVTSQDELVRLIEHERESGVFLTVLGVGSGNLQDATMEALADKGNGNYAYLDSFDEARRVLVREMDATLVTVAKDVKIQVEFNPRHVAAYRLIGYENRRLATEDFNDDAKDAGELGAGQTVTALYEIVPAGEHVPGRSVDPLKYQQPAAAVDDRREDELMTVSLRYKWPDGARSDRLELVAKAEPGPLGRNLGFASAVAELGLLLSRSEYAGTANAESLIERARTFTGADPDGDRTGFVALAHRADGLMREARAGR